MKSLPFLALALASCASVSPAPAQPRGKVVYRYVNTLDVGKNNTLDAVSVTGYDESGVKEATCLVVKIGGSSLDIRDPGGGGAMYNPAVELKPDGALSVSWEQIGEAHCRADIVAGSDGKLTEPKRVTNP
jgi:hypothetical protein